MRADTLFNVQHLLCNTRGEVKLQANAAYRDGKAMLSVYAFLLPQYCSPYDYATRYKMRARRTVYRVMVDRDMSKAEKARVLRSMCDMFTVEHGVPHTVRSNIFK